MTFYCPNNEEAATLLALSSDVSEGADGDTPVCPHLHSWCPYYKECIPAWAACLPPSSFGAVTKVRLFVLEELSYVFRWIYCFIGFVACCHCVACVKKSCHRH